MPTASDLIAYGAASRPNDDASTTGGAQDDTARPLDSQFSSTAAAALVSDDAGDSMNVDVVGRDAAGEVVSETIALNGTTEVTTTQEYERILTVTIASAATGTVTLSEGSGGTTRHTFAPGELDAFIFFRRAVADADAQEDRYEKYFWENTHATESLTSAGLTLTADPNSNYEVAVGGAVDDSESVADRTTAPTGETFVDDSVEQSVPGDDLAAGEAIGHWVKQTLSAAQAAAKDTFTTQLAGNSV